MYAGDAGGIVGSIGLIAPGAQGVDVALARQQAVPDGVGLVSVGDHRHLPHLAHRVVDDEARVFQKRGIVGLGADAVGLDGEDAVAAVDRATHDEVVHRILAHHDASARVGVVLQQFDEILHGRSLSLEALRRCRDSCAFRIGPRRVGIFCIPPNEKGQAPPARRLAQTVGGISALLPRGFPRVPVSHSAFASGSRVSRKEPPEEERSPFSHGFSVGGSRTGRAATPAPGSSRGGCGPRRCSAACNAHRPARPRWRWPAQPGS